jgi:hypothetical protein
MPNVDPKHWGDITWKALEFMLIGFDPTPERPAEICVAFFRDHLGAMLPCERCRLNWKATYAQFPLDDHMGSVASRLAWLHRVRRHIAAHRGSGSGSDGASDSAAWALAVVILLGLCGAGVVLAAVLLK